MNVRLVEDMEDRLANYPAHNEQRELSERGKRREGDACGSGRGIDWKIVFFQKTREKMKGSAEKSSLRIPECN